MPLNPTDLQAATQAIDRAEKILICPHANVDPDGLSSALACYSVFTQMGKDCTVICPDTLPESLEFLPGFTNLKTSIQNEQQFVITIDCKDGMEVDKLSYTVEDHKVNIIVVPKNGTIKAKDVSLIDAGSDYDLLVIVDSADLSLLGSFYKDHMDLFSSVPILNVDHHVSNTRFGQLQLIDPTAASATEVLYHWFLATPKWKDLVTPDMATLLLTGLITDTRSFQNPNTTPRSLEVAAALLDCGARQQEIIQHIYKTKPLTTLKIWGRALNRIQVDSEAKIVWSAVSSEDLKEMGAHSKETHGILDELISTVPDADLYVLFTEVEDGGLKASVRSTVAIDANLASGRLFSGGGHARAAGFKIKQYGNFQLAVIEAVSKLKDEIKRQRSAADEVPPQAPVLSSSAVKNPPLSPATKKPTIKNPAPAKPQPKTASVDIVKELGKGA